MLDKINNFGFYNANKTEISLVSYLDKRKQRLLFFKVYTRYVRR